MNMYAILFLILIASSNGGESLGEDVVIDANSLCSAVQGYVNGTDTCYNTTSVTIRVTSTIVFTHIEKCDELPVGCFHVRRVTVLCDPPHGIIQCDYDKPCFADTFILDRSVEFKGCTIRGQLYQSGDKEQGLNLTIRDSIMTEIPNKTTTTTNPFLALLVKPDSNNVVTIPPPPKHLFMFNTVFRDVTLGGLYGVVVLGGVKFNPPFCTHPVGSYQVFVVVHNVTFINCATLVRAVLDLYCSVSLSGSTLTFRNLWTLPETANSKGGDKGGVFSINSNCTANVTKIYILNVSQSTGYGATGVGGVVTVAKQATLTATALEAYNVTTFQGLLYVGSDDYFSQVKIDTFVVSNVLIMPCPNYECGLIILIPSAIVRISIVLARNITGVFLTTRTVDFSCDSCTCLECFGSTSSSPPDALIKIRDSPNISIGNLTLSNAFHNYTFFTAKNSANVTFGTVVVSISKVLGTGKAPMFSIRDSAKTNFGNFAITNVGVVGDGIIECANDTECNFGKLSIVDTATRSSALTLLDRASLSIRSDTVIKNLTVAASLGGIVYCDSTKGIILRNSQIDSVVVVNGSGSILYATGQCWNVVVDGVAVRKASAGGVGGCIVTEGVRQLSITNSDLYECTECDATATTMRQASLLMKSSPSKSFVSITNTRMASPATSNVTDCDWKPTNRKIIAVKKSAGKPPLGREVVSATATITSSLSPARSPVMIHISVLMDSSCVDESLPYHDSWVISPLQKLFGPLTDLGDNAWNGAVWNLVLLFIVLVIHFLIVLICTWKFVYTDHVEIKESFQKSCETLGFPSYTFIVYWLLLQGTVHSFVRSTSKDGSSPLSTFSIIGVFIVFASFFLYPVVWLRRNKYKFHYLEYSSSQMFVVDGRWNVRGVVPGGLWFPERTAHLPFYVDTVPSHWYWYFVDTIHRVFVGSVTGLEVRDGDACTAVGLVLATGFFLYAGLYLWLRPNRTIGLTVLRGVAMLCSGLLCIFALCSFLLDDTITEVLLLVINVTSLGETVVGTLGSFFEYFVKPPEATGGGGELEGRSNHDEDDKTEDEMKVKDEAPYLTL